jgi:anti-anti-sigma regulatory factor
MNLEFLDEGDFLIIKISGTAAPNERLLVKEYLTPHLRLLYPRVIVDLKGLGETEGAYVLGVLNTIKKEFELLGGEVKLCSLKPELYHYFQENRLDQIFDIGKSVEQITFFQSLGCTLQRARD